MGTSSQAQILPTAYAATYTAASAIDFGCAVSYPDSSGQVSPVNVGECMGVAANAVDSGEIVFVVLSGPAYVRISGSVPFGTSGMLKPDTGGVFIAAGADETSQVRCIPDAAQGDTANNDDIVRALVGVGAVHS